MKWSDLPLQPTQRTLRQFGGLCLVFFGGLAIWQWLVRDNLVSAGILSGLALVLGIVGLVRPTALRLLFVAWMIAAFPIGWVISHILLLIVYYGVFTPIGLAFRVIGRDPLELRRRDVSSYWTPKPQVADLHRYFRQF